MEAAYNEEVAHYGVFLITAYHMPDSLTHDLERGSELRAMEGGGGENLPTPTSSAPMKARITKFLCKEVWSKISMTCNFGDPRSISSMSKNSNFNNVS